MSLLDVVASALILAGVYFYGKKSTWGPACSAGGCAMWIWLGVMSGMYSLAVLNGVLFIVNCYNWALWQSRETHMVFHEEQEVMGGNHVKDNKLRNIRH